jgi:RNA polymerase sigma factor (sigma-70 family)
MNRDEIIMSCSDIVHNLVRKYNNHNTDEDLHAEGMIAVVECVDRCLKENMTDLNQIQARCNVWAKNRILSEIYREKIKYADNESALEIQESSEDLRPLIDDVKRTLTPKQLEVFELLLAGHDRFEIMEKLNIKDRQYYNYVNIIKEKIQN